MREWQLWVKNLQKGEEVMEKSELSETLSVKRRADVGKNQPKKRKKFTKEDFFVFFLDKIYKLIIEFANGEGGATAIRSSIARKPFREELFCRTRSSRKGTPVTVITETEALYHILPCQFL